MSNIDKISLGMFFRKYDELNPAEKKIIQNIIEKKIKKVLRFYKNRIYIITTGETPIKNKMKQIHQISNQNQPLPSATWANGVAEVSPKQMGSDSLIGGVRFEDRNYNNEITGKYMC